MTREIFFEDLEEGVIVDIKIHRQKNYEKIQFVRLIKVTDVLTKKEITKYYGSVHDILTDKQKTIDPSSFKYSEACKEAIVRVQSSSVSRYVFKHEKGYVIIPVTATASQNITITLPDLNLFG